ncbi:MAG TPA: hypothetical protein VHK88_14145 [Aquihabitans sp.]|jgi:hypothetical protein|nr:hypothetical protein [Aquihabitans sp.]
MQTTFASHGTDHGAEGALSSEVPLRWLLAFASFGAAAIHFGFAPTHLAANDVHGAFFLAVAWFQVIWALGIAFRPGQLLVRLGIVGNLGVLAVWIVSRTVGISGEVEPFGYPDTVAAVLEATIVVGGLAYATGWLTRRSVSSGLSGAMLGASAIAVAALASTSMLPSLAGDHGPGGHHADAAAEDGSHGDDHGDDHGEPAAVTEVAAAAHDEGHDEGTAHEASAEPVPYDPDLPIDLGGTEGVTPKEQAQAENLIAVTLLQLPQWSDPKVAEAAGFRSIGDGGTGTEHFINREFQNDDVFLDPNKPESLVFDVEDGERKLAAAMYMVKPGTPLDEVPDMGGELMQWHIHDNLCYSPQGTVAGVTNAEGECRPGLIKPPETPMIHVWIRSHECGPFAALEGLGAGSIAEGEERLCDEAHGKHS